MSEPVVVQLGADMTLDFKWFDLRFRMDNLLDEDYNVFYFKSVGNSFFQRGTAISCTSPSKLKVFIYLLLS